MKNSALAGSLVASLLVVAGVAAQGLQPRSYLPVVSNPVTTPIATATPSASPTLTLTPTPTATPAPTAYRWSDPATWGGALPAAGADVVIPAGRTVLLDTDTAALGMLTVNGTLTFEDKNVTLTAESIMVMGSLNIGSVAQPFVSKAIITLTGAKPSDASTFTRGIMVHGGTLSLVGAAPSPVWTKLGDHALAGGKSLTLTQAVNWKAGDQIVVAPTDFYAQAETERFELSAPAAGTRVTMTQALSKTRWGKLQYPTNTGMSLIPDPSYVPAKAPAPMVLDERAEVANLTRNIVIQGADDSDWSTNRFGGNVMIMSLSSQVLVDGVEMRRMGQAGVTGRYPFHWHLLSYDSTGALRGDAAGHILKNSTIWNSSQRCVVIHGTNGVQVRNNICYDIKGHAFFLEDAVERRNVIDGNLALRVRAPAESQLLLISEGHNTVGSSGYWLTNPDNTVTNNTAADAQGNGFWLAYPATPLGMNTNVALRPANMAHGPFDYNTSHSNQGNGLKLDGVAGDPNFPSGPVIYSPTSTGQPSPTERLMPGDTLTTTTFTGIVLYKNLSNAYRNAVNLPQYKEWTSADNVGAYFQGVASFGSIERALIVGKSLNVGAGYPTSYPFFWGAEAPPPPAAFASYHSTVAIKDNTVVDMPYIDCASSTSNWCQLQGTFQTWDLYFWGVDRASDYNSNNKLINAFPGYRTLPAFLNPKNFEHQGRNFALVGAYWDNHGYWGPKGNFWVYDLPFFTSGANCVSVYPHGQNGKSCDGQYYSITDFLTDWRPTPFNGTPKPASDGSFPWGTGPGAGASLWKDAVKVERLNSTGGLIDTWLVPDGYDTNKGHFRHAALRENGTYTLEFPGNPLPKRLAFTIINAYRVTDTFMIGIKFDGTVTPTAYVYAGLMCCEINPGTQEAYKNSYLASRPASIRVFRMASSYNEVVGGNGDLMWQDKANNMLWIKHRGGLTWADPARLQWSWDDKYMQQYILHVY